MKLNLKRLSVLCLFIPVCHTFGCSDDENTPAINKNIITQALYIQFDMIDEQTGDSTRVTRQYRIQNGESHNYIDSVHTQAEVTELYRTEDDAYPIYPANWIYLTFLEKTNIPIDSIKKHKDSYRDSLAKKFTLKTYNYSVKDSSKYPRYSDGMRINIGDFISTATLDKSLNSGIENTFTITFIEPYDTSAAAYSYHIKGNFNCRAKHETTGKIFKLKNGKFSSVVVETARHL